MRLVIVTASFFFMLSAVFAEAPVQKLISTSPLAQEEEIIQQLLDRVTRLEQAVFPEKLKKNIEEKLTQSGDEVLSSPSLTEEGKEVYDQAYAFLKNRDYEKALSGFQDVLIRYPHSEHVPDSYYWIGELHFLERQNEKARHAFSKLINDWPHHSKVPDALLKTGYIAYQEEAYSEAAECLQSLIKNYPNSDAALLGKGRLDRMRQEGKLS